MKHYLVSDWMTKDVVTAEPDTFMLDAHRRMREHKIRRLPVVKRGRLVGIMTRSDVRSAEPSAATTLNVWEMNYLLAQLQVKNVMTSNPITIRPDDTIKRAAELMHDNRIGALPVVKNGNQLVGILTESDVFRILISWFNEEHSE